jgi:aspartyl-tRNA synthetase
MRCSARPPFSYLNLPPMHLYRTETCGELRKDDVGRAVRLSGWVHRLRDHGGLLFIDLRDHYGITQCVVDPDSPAFKLAETFRAEWVVRLDGEVKRRPAIDGKSTDNADMATGRIEVYVREAQVLGQAAELPLPVFGDQDYPEETRLKYRFLDLRRGRIHNNIMLRGKVVDSMRSRMKEAGFNLSASAKAGDAGSTTHWVMP